VYEREGLNKAERVKLVLSARLLAHHLDSSIGDVVDVNTISAAIGGDIASARARLSEIIAEKFAFSATRGKYQAYPHAVSSFLDSLEAKAGG